MSGGGEPRTRAWGWAGIATMGEASRWRRPSGEMATSAASGPITTAQPPSCTRLWWWAHRVGSCRGRSGPVRGPSRRCGGTGSAATAPRSRGPGAGGVQGRQGDLLVALHPGLSLGEQGVVSTTPASDDSVIRSIVTPSTSSPMPVKVTPEERCRPRIRLRGNASSRDGPVRHAERCRSGADSRTIVAFPHA